MKCQEFEFSVRELARHQLFGELIEAGLRVHLTEHAHTCAACCARLTDERSLTEVLRALSTDMDGHNAPFHIEAALLTAFRQSAPTAVVPLAGARLRRYWPRLAFAAAAVLLVGLFSYAAQLTLRDKREQHTGQAMTAGNEHTPKPVQTQTAGAQPVASVTLSAPADQPVALENVSSALNQVTGNLTAGQSKPVKAKRPTPHYRIERYLVESEIATDFLPLNDNEEVPQNVNLQTIRVEVPRVLLSRFGLPMSFERATEPVKADLLIGPDGQTHAIRFVQSDFEQPQIISALTPRER